MSMTHPSTLFRYPLGDLLRHDELDDESDDVAEESSNSSLDHRHSNTISETQQSNYPAPRDPAVTEQSADKAQCVH